LKAGAARNETSRLKMGVRARAPFPTCELAAIELCFLGF